MLGPWIKQIGSGQTRYGKSEHQHFRNEWTKMDWFVVESVSHVQCLWPHGLFVARQTPLAIEFSKQECQNGLPFPFPGDLPEHQTRVSYTAGRFFTNWATREVPKWTGMGGFNSGDHYVYYCGQEFLRENGVAITVNKGPKCSTWMQSHKRKNDLCLSPSKPFNITVMQVYVLTSNTEQADVEQFYDDLQDLLELTPKTDVVFIIGDWNVQVGIHKIPGVTGKFDLGVQNETGQRQTELCKENVLVVANTLFQQHKRRLYTRTSPDGQWWNQTYSIFCSQRWRHSIQSPKTRLGAVYGSDHELPIAKFRLKLKKVRETTRQFRYDLNQIP